MWFNLPRLTAPFIWFRKFELDYGYLMTYCFFYMGHSLCHTISILGPYMAHITRFGKGCIYIYTGAIHIPIYLLRGRGGHLISPKLVFIAIHGKISFVMNLLFSTW